MWLFWIKMFVTATGAKNLETFTGAWFTPWEPWDLEMEVQTRNSANTFFSSKPQLGYFGPHTGVTVNLWWWQLLRQSTHLGIKPSTRHFGRITTQVLSAPPRYYFQTCKKSRALVPHTCLKLDVMGGCEPHSHQAPLGVNSSHKVSKRQFSLWPKGHFGGLES